MDLLENNQFLISKAKRIIEVNQSLSYRELRQKLKKKEIPEDIIDQVLELNKSKELENAIRLLRMKSKLVKGNSRSVVKQKLLRHLMSKGFDYSTSSKALSDLL